MDLIIDLLLTFTDFLLGTKGKKYRFLDYLLIFIITLSVMLVAIGKYDFESIGISIVFATLVSMVFGTITNAILKFRKNK
jgi:hypothetical protein